MPSCGGLPTRYFLRRSFGSLHGSHTRLHLSSDMGNDAHHSLYQHQLPPMMHLMLLGPEEHEMHHRGQLMLIERMVGVVPHITREMQARMAAMQATKATA